MSPSTGEGNCRCFVVIDTSHSDLTASAVPRHALTFLSIVFRCASNPNQPPRNQPPGCLQDLRVAGRCDKTRRVKTRRRENLPRFRVSRLERGGSLTLTSGPHARITSTCSSWSAKSAAPICDVGLWCRMTQAGHTLRLRQPRIQGPPLSAGGTPAACAKAEAALPPERQARSPPPRSPSVPPPPHAARRP